MLIDPAKLLNLTYLLERRPEPNSALIFVLAFVFAALIVASGLVWVVLIPSVRRLPPAAAIRSRFSNWLFTNGLVGLLLVFFRWQGIAWLGSRIWLLIWLLFALIWGIRLIYYLLKKFPVERRVFEDRRRFERYLPKRKIRNSKF